MAKMISDYHGKVLQRRHLKGTPPVVPYYPRHQQIILICIFPPIKGTKIINTKLDNNHHELRGHVNYTIQI